MGALTQAGDPSSSPGTFPEDLSVLERIREGLLNVGSLTFPTLALAPFSESVDDRAQGTLFAVGSGFNEPIEVLLDKLTARGTPHSPAAIPPSITIPLSAEVSTGREKAEEKLGSRQEVQDIETVAQGALLGAASSGLYGLARQGVATFLFKQRSKELIARLEEIRKRALKRIELSGGNPDAIPIGDVFEFSKILKSLDNIANQSVLDAREMFDIGNITPLGEGAAISIQRLLLAPEQREGLPKSRSTTIQGTPQPSIRVTTRPEIKEGK